MFEWIKARLIDEARLWWRMWSVRLAAVMSAVVAYVLASPDIIVRVMNELPPEFRAAFPPATGILLFALVTVVRLYKQGPKNGA